MDLDKGNSKAAEALGPEQEGQNPSQFNYLLIIYFSLKIIRLPVALDGFMV